MEEIKKPIRKYNKLSQSIIANYPNKLKEIIGDQQKIEFQGKLLKKEKIIHFIDGLIKKYYNSDNTQFNLSSRILQEKYGMTYKYYVKFLVEHNLLNYVSTYKIGEKCITYRIDKDIVKNSSLYEITDKVLLKKRAKYYTDIKLRNLSNNNIPFNIKKILRDNLFKISIEYNKASFMLNSTQMSDLSRKKSEYSITAINKMDRWMSFDNFSRFHSVFTTLKSEVRKACLIDKISGNKLDKEIDIGSSQPLFLVSVINKSSLKYLIDEDELNYFKILLRPDKKKNKASIYYLLLKAGKYKSIEEAKRSVYRVFFGPNNNRKENRIFKKLFPTIYNFIVQYKKEHGHYNSLSHELQREESNWMFNNTINKILNTIPDLVFFTVHDSITVSSKDYNKVKKIFDKELKKLYDELDI